MLPLLLAAMLHAGDLSGDPRMLDFFTDVIAHSGYSRDYAEAAAFLVRDTRGDLQCLLWPRTNQYHSQTFLGGVPMGTVAIVHTHPDLMFAPSALDMEQARALHLPMVVLTPSHIAVYDPETRTTSYVIANRYWVPRKVTEHCADDWLAR